MTKGFKEEIPVNRIKALMSRLDDEIEGANALRHLHILMNKHNILWRDIVEAIMPVIKKANDNIQKENETISQDIFLSEIVSQKSLSPLDTFVRAEIPRSEYKEVPYDDTPSYVKGEFIVHQKVDMAGGRIRKWTIFVYNDEKQVFYRLAVSSAGDIKHIEDMVKYNKRLISGNTSQSQKGACPVLFCERNAVFA